MSGHFGEDETEIIIGPDQFQMRFINRHDKRSAITVSGPIVGLFDDLGRKMDEGAARALGQGLARFFAEFYGNEGRQRGLYK